MKTYFDLCEFLQLAPEAQNFDLKHLVIDSRRVTPGDVFCAYQGASTDGHDYIEAAIDQGAVLILAEKTTKQFSIPVLVAADLAQCLSKLAAWFYDHPSKKLNLIGVTGTNGKTSTTHYMAQFLHLLGRRVGVMGSLGRGPWGQLTESTLNTPQAVDLQRQLAEFVSQQIDYVCMEVSSHAIAQGRINDVTFTSAVFTNLTQDHLDFHHSMENYADTKAKFFAWPNLKTAILNKDDDYSAQMLKQVALTSKVYYYSLKDHDDSIIHAKNLVLDQRGISFDLHSPFGTAEIKTQLLGEFNASNILAAITTLLSLNFPLAELAKLSIFLQPVKGRMEVLRYDNLPMVVLDYAHTPDALEKVLNTLKTYQQPLWVVFGCGGDRDAGKRPLMAAISERYADQVIVTEDNSRFENPDKIFADIFKGFNNADKVQLIQARADAIYYVLKHAPKNAIVLLAGKGHETYLDTQGEKLDFDEREIIKAFKKV